VQIAVYCGSSRRCREPYLEAARRLGSEIARAGHVLVYGAMRSGLMGALADAALEAGGRVEGVILRAWTSDGQHHDGLHELEIVDGMRERKAGLDVRADAFIALPGGLGTLDELVEILVLRKIDTHRRPVVLLNTAGFFEPFLELIERAVREDFELPGVRDFFAVSDDPARAVALCAAAEPERMDPPAS
jgi:uncharacterized protein (TIGR00730 family)